MARENKTSYKKILLPMEKEQNQTNYKKYYCRRREHKTSYKKIIIVDGEKTKPSTKTIIAIGENAVWRGFEFFWIMRNTTHGLKRIMHTNKQELRGLANPYIQWQVKSIFNYSRKKLHDTMQPFNMSHAQTVA